MLTGLPEDYAYICLQKRNLCSVRVQLSEAGRYSLIMFRDTKRIKIFSWISVRSCVYIYVNKIINRLPVRMAATKR